jgi:hypothetical protein
MLDLLLIQDNCSGLNLFEYRSRNTTIGIDHEIVFSGFLSAIQKLTEEVKLGNLKQISTSDHHCLFLQKECISVVLIIDVLDEASIWFEKASEIAHSFIERFGLQYDACNYGFFRCFQTHLQLLSIF